MGRYVVSYEADFEPQRSRLTTFFRLLLVIPHAIVVAILGIGVFVAVVIGWFALLITGRMPSGLYAFVVGFLRLSTQVTSYAMLVTDRYPPFGLDATDYPVRVAAPEAPAAGQSRLKVLFRLLLVIPWYIVATAYFYVAMFAAVGSWFAIVVTGRQPEFLQRGLHMGIAAQLFYESFLMLVTEAWPPFEPELRLEPRAEPPAISAAA